MKLKILIASIIILSIFSSNTFSQTIYTNGCYVAADAKIYINIGGNCFQGIFVCDGTDPQNEYVVIKTNHGTNCTACRTGNPPGQLVDFYSYSCPIDDYVWPLFFTLGIISFLILRKRLHLFTISS